MRNKALYWRLCWAFAFALALLINVAPRAEFPGIKKATEFIAVPVHLPIDSAGIPHVPDSIQVITYADKGTSSAYFASGAAYACAGIDTTKTGGGAQIWFVDQIQDIDGDGTASELAIQVIAWVHLLPTETFATVQVIPDSLGIYCRGIIASLDSLNAQDGWIAKEASVTAARDTAHLAHENAHSALDSLQAQDGWIAKEATSIFIHDTVNAILDSNNNFGTIGELATLLTDTFNVRGSVAVKSGGIISASFAANAIDASAIAAGAINVSEAPNLDAAISTRGTSTYASATDSVIVKMAAFNTSLDNDTSLVTFLRACLYTAAAARDTSHLAHADAQDGLDTLKNQDNWIGTSDFDPTSDSVLVKMAAFNAALDNDTGLVAFLRAGVYMATAARDTSHLAHDKAKSALDSLQAQDNWVSSFDPTSDSVIVKMTSFNTSLDNDTTLVGFLRSIGSSTFDPTSDSVLVKMAAFNTALDNDTSLVAFLRACQYSALAARDTANLAHVAALAARDTANLAHADAHTGLDSLRSQDGWVAKQAYLDSLSWRLGYGAGAKAWGKFAADADTLIFLHYADSIGGQNYIHVNGSAGDAPDTTKYITGDSL